MEHVVKQIEKRIEVIKAFYTLMMKSFFRKYSVQGADIECARKWKD